jgi:hypothetical protein
MSSELDFGDFMPRDDRARTMARTRDVIDISVTVSSYAHICDSRFIIAASFFSVRWRSAVQRC